MNKLYTIFIESIIESIKKNDSEIKNPKNWLFYTTQGTLYPWNKNLKMFLNEYYSKDVKEFLSKQNLIKIDETTLFGVYKDNYFEPLDIALINNDKDKEIKARTVAPLMGDSEVYREFKRVFYNALKLQETQILDFWKIFTNSFFTETNKKPINIFQNQESTKKGVVIAIKNGYLKITNDNIEFLPLETKLPFRTIFQLPVEFKDIKLWNNLTINQNDSNYSIFKEFIISKTDNIQAIASVLADLFQPQLNTEILPILVGSGGGGKSTLQNLLRNILSEKIVGAVNLIQALNNPFEREILYTHPIVFTSELESSTLKEQATLKQLISREITQLNLKHQAVKIARPIAKMLVASNHILKTTDSDGINRRILFISFKNNKVRTDLTEQEFNKLLFNDVIGLTALIILGTQFLLQNGWNYQTFNFLSDVELQKEFEGQYSILNNFLTEMLDANFIIQKENDFLSLSAVADLLKVLSLSQLDSNSVNDEILNIIETFNIKTDNKRNMLTKMKASGFDKLASKLKYRYNLKTEIIKVGNERKYTTNAGYRIQQSYILSNLQFNFNNETFLNILTNSYISLDKLENIIPNLKETLKPEWLVYEVDGKYFDRPLKEIHIPLIWLFHKDAPLLETLNKTIIDDEEFNKIENKYFREKKRCF